MIKGRYFALTLAVGAPIILAGCSRHEEAAMTAPPAAAPAPAPAPAPSPTVEAQQPVELTPSQIRRMQAGLKQYGFYTGRVDGVYGPQTQSAVSKFQTQNGLPATGQVDQATLEKMQGEGGMLTGGGPGVSRPPG